MKGTSFVLAAGVAALATATYYIAAIPKEDSYRVPPIVSKLHGLTLEALATLTDLNFYRSGRAVMLLLKGILLSGIIAFVTSSILAVLANWWHWCRRFLSGKSKVTPTYQPARPEDFHEVLERKQEEIRQKAAARQELEKQRREAELAQQEKAYQTAFPGKPITTCQVTATGESREVQGTSLLVAMDPNRQPKKVDMKIRKDAEEERRAVEARRKAAAAAQSREMEEAESIRQRQEELQKQEERKRQLARERKLAEVADQERRYQLPYQGTGHVLGGTPGTTAGGSGSGSRGEEGLQERLERVARERAMRETGGVGESRSSRDEAMEAKREKLTKAHEDVLRLRTEHGAWEQRMRDATAKMKRAEMQLRLGRLTDERKQAEVEHDVAELQKQVEGLQEEGQALEKSLEVAKRDLEIANASSGEE